MDTNPTTTEAEVTEAVEALLKDCIAGETNGELQYSYLEGLLDFPFEHVGRSQADFDGEANDYAADFSHDA